MSDAIRLLPDAIANQIAAGEVIQRPASVVKELLENALDAGANNIQLLLKDAGRTLIQISDNGSGMSPTDARMCFEKHATSKITSADDLFCLHTLGFRGEALASIAAIAHVELRTRRAEDELGTKIIIEGSHFKSQENCSCPIGTTLMVKNLFYNVPARRKFLKTNNAELRHINEEFQRVAMVHPQVQFSMTHNDKILYQLKGTHLKQRLAHIIGTAKYEEKLIPIEEGTDAVRISGYIGKPEYARKKRGEQYFFANQRFIKHPYFNHAVEQAYKELIPDSAYPSYFIFLEVAPEDIDVNIHPTKVEVNFADKQLIYAVLAAAVKKAVGQFSVAPTIDFSPESNANFLFPKDKVPQTPKIHINPDYNPFEQQAAQERQLQAKHNLEHWERAYQPSNTTTAPSMPSPHEETKTDLFLSDLNTASHQAQDDKQAHFIQIGKQYIATTTKSALLLIHQQHADERILYEGFLNKYEHKSIQSQQLMFPVNIKLNADEIAVIKELLQEIEQFGFRIDFMGQHTMVVNAAPTDVKESQIPQVFDELIADFARGQDLRQDAKIAFAKSMARRSAIKTGQALSQEEMEQLVNALFACQVSDISIRGEQIWKAVDFPSIETIFKA